MTPFKKGLRVTLKPFTWRSYNSKIVLNSVAGTGRTLHARCFLMRLCSVSSTDNDNALLKSEISLAVQHQAGEVW